MRRLPDSNYLGSFCLAPFHYILHSTAAMAAPSTADATMGDATTPDRASTPEVAVTTDSSDHGTPPPQSYNDSNYQFNHSQPGNTVYYNPTTVMDQLHITEHQTTAPYTRFFTALTLEEYQLLSQQQTTPLAQLDHTRPIHCIPGDLRMPHYNSTLLSISLPEAANVHYYHTTSLHTTTGDNTNYVIIQLQIEQPVLLRHLTSGQFLHFTRDISYMMSIQQDYYLPTTTIPQTIHKVNYNMTTFTDNYSLRNNYLWNYRPYYYLSYSTTFTTETNYTTYYHPLQEHPVLRIHTTHHDKPHSTSQSTTTPLSQGVRPTHVVPRDR